MANQIIIPKIEDYNTEVINGNLVATPKKKYIGECDLTNYNFVHSNIIKPDESTEYGVKSRHETVSTATAHNTILKDIYKFLNIPNKNYGLSRTEALKKICKLVKENGMSVNLPIGLKESKLSTTFYEYVYLKIDS